MIDKRYQIVGKIGAGGFGNVFKAIDLFRREIVAVKVLSSKEPEYVERFKKEFLLLRKLDYPNIVNVYDFGFTAASEAYFSMDYIEGKDLKSFLRPLEYPKFWELLIQICSTLDFLHCKRIIHGDLKPHNILITNCPNGQPTVKFTDFGFAEYESGKVKDSAWWKGTLSYLAPEIIRGEKHNHQADLYSLGVLIYETIFGKRPFDEEEVADLARSHLEKEIVIPQEHSVPSGLKNLIINLLEKDPIDRYFSAKEVLSEVDKISRIKPEGLETSLAKSLISSCDFVGREKELALLKEAFYRANIGQFAVVLVSGESGVGKTRLLKEFKTSAQVEGAVVLDVDPGETEILKVSQDGHQRLSEDFSQPLILIFDHMEEVEHLILEYLVDLIQKTQKREVLICMTLANEFTCSDKDKIALEVEEKIKSMLGNKLVQIKLDNLTENETKQMLYSMFSLRGKEEEMLGLTYRRTGGNPFLIKELMDSLANDGAFHRQNGHWTIELEQIARSRIPPKLASNLTNRLARLSKDELNLISEASILGTEFGIDLLEELSGTERETLSKQLEGLLSEQILVQSSSTSEKEIVFFHNGFTRDFIYQQIDLQERKRLHEKVGHSLEKKYASELADHIVQLADHFYQTSGSERAMKYAILAAQRAKSIGKRGQAIKHYRRILELYDRYSLPPGMPKEEILENLAEQYEAEGDYIKSLHYYQSAFETLKATNPNDQRLPRVCRGIGKIFDKASDYEKAAEFFNHALQLLNPEKSPEEFASVLIDLGWHHSSRGEHQKALNHLQKAIFVLKNKEPSKETGSAFFCLGGVHWSLGNYPEALLNLSQSLEVFQKLAEFENTAECYITLGLVKRSQGFPVEALEYYQKAQEVITSFYDPYKLSILQNNLALVYMDLNRWNDALECLSESMKFKSQISHLKGLGLCQNNMGLIYLKKGLFRKSLQHLNMALQLFREIRDRSGVALVYYNLGDLHRYKQEHDKALHYLKRSLKIARELGDESRITDCMLLLGKIAIDQGDLNLSTQNLTEAAELYLKGGNAFGQADTQLALAELGLARNNIGQAEKHLEQVKVFIKSSGNKWFEGCFKKVCAHLMKAKEEEDTYLEYLLKSASIFKELGAKYELGEIYLELGELKLKIRRIKEGRALLSEALNIFEKSEAEKKREEVEALLDQLKEMQSIEGEKIQTFYRLAELLNSIWDTDELLSKSLELVIELLNAERGAIILYSEKDKTFEIKASKGLEPETSADAVAVSRKVLTDVIKSETPLIVANAQESPELATSKSVVIYNILSILCVPLRTRNRLIGTIYLDHRSLPAVFSTEDIDFLNAFAHLIATAIEKSELYVKANEELFQLKVLLGSSYEYPYIVGKSEKMQEIFNLVEKVADSKTSVLIYGESGTGKELIAHLIHSRSSRRDGPFIRVNCAALPETLLESELFGIEEKTATGVGFRKGKFELAHQGTIFLDEIGDMSLSVQAKVLRVLQEKEFERVGGQKSIKVDIRVISATNMDLQRKVQHGTFRRDLYYRLNPIIIAIPPLRERKEDIPYLARYFSEKFAKENHKPELKLTKRLMNILENHQWPGNVRELEHLMESATLLSENGEFPKNLFDGEFGKQKELVNIDRYGKLQEVLDWVEKKKIAQALEKNGWNQIKTAKELGMNETTLRRRIKKHKIKKRLKLNSHK
jgi:Nif-specific regulatory protein